MKSPAFQFYPTDYLGSQRVRLMTLEEEGVYLNLLCSCWQHGSIPADPELVARLVGKGCSTTVATTVLTMFTPGPVAGRMIHDRLEVEREKQAVWRAKSAAGGRKSAEIRKGGSRVVEAPHQPNGNTPSPIPSSSPIRQTEVAGAPGSVAAGKTSRTPTIEEWVARCQLDHPDWPRTDAESAWRHYESQGWKRGKTPIVKWGACVATCYSNWKSRGSERGLFAVEQPIRIPENLRPGYVRDQEAQG